MNKAIVSLLFFAILKVVKGDVVQLESYLELSVPCRYRFELYRSHFDELLEFRRSMRDGVGLKEPYRGSFVEDYLKGTQYLEQLVLILDRTLLNTFEKSLSQLESCRNFKKIATDQIDSADLLLPQSPSFLSNIVSSGQSQHQLSDEMKARTHPQEMYLKLLLELIRVKAFSIDQEAPDFFYCHKVTRKSAETNYGLNFWLIKAQMHSLFEERAKFYMQTIKSVIQNLIDDYPRIKKIFFHHYSITKLTKISSTSGDQHKEAGIVVILTFDHGPQASVETPSFTKIVYKPSTVLIDWLINGETRYFCSSALQEEDSELNGKNNASDVEDEKLGRADKDEDSDEGPNKNIASRKNLFKELCKKLSPSFGEQDKLYIGSFVEMLNAFEIDRQRHLRVYRILPIEDVDSNLPEPEVFSTAHQSISDLLKLGQSGDKRLSDEQIQTTKQKIMESRRSLQKYMVHRMAKVRGYIEFLENEFIQDVDADQVLELKKKVGSLYTKTAMDNIFFNTLNDQNKAFQEGDEINYSYKVGKLIQMVYMLSSTDMHYENVMVSKKDPILIDYENSFNPARKYTAINLVTDYKLGAFNPMLSSNLIDLEVFKYDSDKREMHYIKNIRAFEIGKPMILLDIGNPESKYYKKRYSVDKDPEVDKLIAPYFEASAVHYNEDENRMGKEFVMSSVCQRNYRQVLAKEGIDKKYIHEEMFMDWIKAPIMKEVIIREVTIATSDWFSLVETAQLLKLESEELLVKAIGLLHKSRISFGIIGHDDHLPFTNSLKVKDLTQLAQLQVKKVEEMIDLNDEFIIELAAGMLEYDNKLELMMRHWSGAINAHSDCIEFARNQVINLDPKNEFVRAHSRLIDDLQEALRIEISPVKVNGITFKQVIKNTIYTLKATQAFCGANKGEELDAFNSYQSTKVDIQFKRPMFNKEQILSGKNSKEENDLMLRKHNPVGENPKSKSDVDFSAAFQAWQNSQKSAAKDDLSSAIADQNTLSEKTAAIELEPSQIPQKSPSDESQKLSPRREGQNGLKEDDSEEEEEYSETEKTVRNTALPDKRNQCYSKMSNLDQQIEELMAKYHDARDAKTNFRRKFKKNLEKRVPFWHAEGSLGKLLIDLRQNQKLDDKKEFKKAFKKFTRILRQVQFGKKKLDTVASEDGKVAVRIARGIHELYRKRKFSLVHKSALSLLTMNLIDMIMKGMIPATYALASDSFLYSPVGVHVIPGFDEISNPEYTFVKVAEGLRKAIEDDIKQESHPAQFEDELKSLDQLLAELKNFENGDVPYYSKKPLDHMLELFEKHVKNCKTAYNLKSKEDQLLLLI